MSINTVQESGLVMEKGVSANKSKKESVLKTNINGFDVLFAGNGVPRGNSVLVAGGTGTGKSTFCRQICYNLVSEGKKNVCM